MRHGRTEARTHGGTDAPERPASAHAVRLLRLCLCAAIVACTDPRARVAPPTVQVIVSPGLHVRSPGTIPASIYAYAFEGFDSLRVALRTGVPGFGGDSLYLFPDTTEATTGVVWTVPSGVAAGTRITLVAKVWNLIGFAASDSVVLTSE